MLFEDWSDFEGALTPARTPSTSTVFNESETGARVAAELAEAVQQGEPVSRAAEAAGIDVHAAMAICANAGVRFVRRPKKLDRERSAALSKALEKGTSKDEIERKMGLSRASINRYLRTHPAIAKKHSEVMLETERRKRRASWTRLLGRYPSAAYSRARAESPGLYTWLYRHDRAWLQSTKPAEIPVPSPRRSSVDWEQRDLALAESVDRGARELVHRGATLPLSYWQLCEAVPGLREVYRSDARLSDTAKAIAQWTE